MLMFMLAISCLTTSNLPWFMDLTFQVPMQYCSLQHHTLLLSPVTPTTGYCFCFGSIPSFFLELFLHWSPVHIGHLLTWGVHLSVSYLFAFSWGSQGKNTEVVCHSLLQWITYCQTSPPWPVHLGWPHMAWLSFIELDKAVFRVIRLASFLWLWFQCVCPLMPSHKITEITETSFKKSYANTAAFSAPEPAAGHCRPMPLLETPGHSRASLGQSLVKSLLLSPGSWCAQGFVRALQESISPVLSSWGSIVGLMATSSKRAYAIARSAAPRVPAPAAGQCWPIPLQETLKHSSGSVSVGSLGHGVHKVCLRPLSVSGRYGVWF